MESYELESNDVIEWAYYYAGYDELEEVAKSIYGIYVDRRKKERPDEHRKNRQKRNKKS